MGEAETSLARILREQGRTQRWLCGRVGMNSDRMHRLCTGKTSLELDESIAIAAALGVEVTELAEVAVVGND